MLSNIKIGAIHYKVALEKKSLGEDKCDGLIDYAQARISISEDQDDQIKVQTLLHEIIHGIMAQAGFTDHDEGVLNALAYGLIQVIRDNPELVKLLVPETITISSLWDSNVKFSPYTVISTP